MRLQAPAERFLVVSPGLRSLAADEDQLRAQDVDEIRDRLAEHGRRLGEDRACVGVAGVGLAAQSGDPLALADRSVAARDRDERRVADDRLEAAALPARAHRAVDDGRHVPELAGSPAVTVVDVAVRDDAEPDAAAERERDEVLDVAAAAVEPLRGRERVHVVVDEHRDPELLLQRVAQREVAPADQRRGHPAGRAVDDARHAEADAEERGLCRAPRRASRCSTFDRGVEAVRGGQVEPRLELLDHVAVEVDDDADEVVGRDLHAERVRRAADDLEQEGRTAATGGSAVGRPDDPALDQLARDRRHGRGAEAEALRDRRARDRPGEPDQPQDRCAVQVAGEARRAGPVGHRLDNKFMF